MAVLWWTPALTATSVQADGWLSLEHVIVGALVAVATAAFTAARLRLPLSALSCVTGTRVMSAG
ncbi:hypothetical protein [Glycomyces sp. YM15]|uniref:hypothetical protein n=1 Tax=Glycomyces sp. YM15 TaxID=2800446 RepID=UPI00196532BC|nr:hypothetical protein [Glycomyces sp. YM15]